jgi:hypothetical protein
MREQLSYWRQELAVAVLAILASAKSLRSFGLRTEANQAGYIAWAQALPG